VITNEIGPHVLSTFFKTVALGVAAAAALTACGGPVKMGAAAVFDDRRITVAQLDQTVSDWKKQLDKDPAALELQQGGQQVPADPDSPPRSALVQLVDFRIWDELAREQHVEVTPTQIDQIIAANGGKKAVDDLTLAHGLPVSHARDVVRAFVIHSLLLQRYGAVPNQQGQVDQQAQQLATQRLGVAYGQATRTLKIKINPRYGSFDPNNGLGPVSYGLSRPDPGLNGAG
jgi:hypothetical protein